MKSPRLSFALFVTLLLLLVASAVQAAAPVAIPGELIVKFKLGASPTSRALALARVPSSTTLHDLPLINAEHVHFSGMSMDEAIAKLREDPFVVYAEPNYEIHLEATPNDPRFPELYGMLNTGQTGGTPGADIRATLAWDLFTGDPNLKVGIIDTGIDYNHPDLAENIWTNPGEVPGNGIDDDHNGYVDDIHGYDFVNNDGDPMDDHFHGTHCAGTIAGVGNNGVGVAGVNWRCQLVGIKFLNAGGGGSTEAAIQAVQYAVAVGVKLTSNSWGGGGFSEALLDAINAAGGAGQLFVAAAGNAGSDIDVTPTYPAGYDSPYIISVAATDAFDQLASFSNWGRVSVDLGAPGVDILSCLPGANYGLLSGTSMATPHVAGAVALIAGRFPAASNLQIKDLLLASTDSIPSLAGRVLTNGRLNVFRAIQSPDSIVPGTVGDLATDTPGSTTMGLSWTAVGDDGGDGRAAQYDLRFSTAPIDEGNFAAATRATTPAPHVAGTHETCEVSGLGFSTPYYFALKVVDEMGNTSELSNLTSGTTLGIPHIAIAPSSFTQALLTGEQASQTLTVSNIGAGRLDFTAPTPEQLLTQMGTFASTPVEPDTRLIKDQADPRPGGLGSHGPDRAGYRWIDSDDPKGPTFDWVDITRVGRPLALLGDDALSTPTDIGFEFPFYGRKFGSVRVCTNGFLAFTGDTPAFANGPLPTAAAPADLVAPLWDDLGVSGPRSVYTYNDGSRFIVSYIGVPSHSPGGGVHTFQVLLYPSGEIRYQYLSLGQDRSSATVGIQGNPAATAEIGLQVAFNTSYLHDRQTVEFLPLHQWLNVSPESGRVAAGSSTDVQVNFDAAGMFGGIYLGNVLLDSNDPSLPRATATAELSVTGAPDIAVVPDSLDFGPVFITTSRTDSIVVRNVGTDLLSVTSVSASPGTFTVPGGGFDLGPGGTQTLSVTFTPTSPGPVTGSLMIASNDHDEPVVTVPLFAQALVPPDVSIAPDSLIADLFTGEQALRTMTITNSGGSPLAFTLSARRTGVSQAPLSSTPVAIPDSLRRPSPNTTAPNTAAPTPQAIYTGTYLQFGITAFGEIMPYQFPIGNEHLALGTPLSGYTLAYFASGFDHVAFAVHSGLQGIVPVSYQELENTPSRVVVEVVTQTSDGLLSIRRLFTFPRDRQYVQVQSTVRNLSGTPIAAVVLKEDADWDVDGNFYDTWNYDRDRNMVFASNVRFVAIASEQTPDVMDINGWNDYYTRSTTVEFPVGPVLGFDGLEVLHFELGTLAPQQSRDVKLAYGAGNSLEELQHVMDTAVSRVPWLTFSPSEGTVPPGSAQDVLVTFDATGLFGGDYLADLHVGSNDPDETDLALPTHLRVTGAPDIAVDPDSLDFGTLFVGVSRVDSVVVRNAGTDALVVAGVTASPAAYSVPGAGFSLAPGEARVLVVTFLPPSPGTIPGALQISSNDPGTPVATVFLTGEGLVPPDVSIAPDSLTADLFTGEQATRTMTITNSGGSPLLFAVSSQRTSGPEAARSTAPVPIPDALRGPTLNQSQPHTGGPTAQAIYQGTYLQFGITAYGEVMPYQFPVGNEHLALGTPLSGYTLAYVSGGLDHLTWSVNDSHNGIEPVSYRELENTAARVVVEVVTRTSDGVLGITRVLTFPRDRQYVQVQSTVQNLTGAPVSAVVLKEDADWDADGNFNNTWDYDRDRNMVFASNIHYVAIASEQTPDVMDLYGWNDFSTRTTTVDFPVGPVPGLDGLEVLHYELGSLAPLQTRSVKVAYGAGNSLAELQHVMDEAVSRVPWLTFSPTQGAVPAGSTQDVLVTFDASGLFGGDYRADIHVGSNDPDETDLAMPTHLHVTGAPDIAVNPDSLDFGTQFVGVTRVDSVVVRNVGTDVLTVTSVSIAPADFTAPGAGFSLAPGDVRILPVAFSPGTPSAITGTLVVASDDPDHPSVTVHLSGQGLVPPDISLAPDSLTADLLTGEQTTRTLTITNSGGSDLAFHVFTGPAATAAAAPVAVSHESIQRRDGPPRATHALTADAPSTPLSLAIHRAPVALGGQVLVIADGGTQVDVDSVLSAAGYVVTLVPDDSAWNGNDPSPAGFAAVVLLDGPGVGSDMPLGGQLALMDYVNNGGGLVLTEWSGYEVSSGRYASMHPLVPLTWGGYTDGLFTYNVVASHPVTAGVSPSFNVASAADLGSLNSGTAVVTNSSGFPMVIVKELGLGRIVHFAAGGNYNGFRPFTSPDMQRLLVNAADWVGGKQWLRFSPADGTIPAGTSLDVVATFDAARLFGGDYRASVHVASNDPDESDLSIPAHLHVTGAPDILVTPDSLDFGSLFVGATRVDSVVVKNTGTDMLSVSSVTASPGDYSVPGASFDLAPGASQLLPVTFTPASAASIPGTVLIASNDPDEGVVTVRLTGEGLIAPDIALSPDSLVADLLSGQTAIRTLTLTNAGGSNLTWSTELGGSAAASVLSASPVFGPSAPAPDKTVLTVPPPRVPEDRLYSSPVNAKAPTGLVRSASLSQPVIAAGSLGEALANLDADYGEVIGAIPGRFDFFEGEVGNSIGDGGNDMYDGGNFLSTELGGLSYSNGVIVPSGAFGPSGQYFTRKYPGLFVLVADMQGINTFAISGNLGADGSGNVDGSVLQAVSGGVTYRAFIKRVFNAGDPSVNHMIIVANDSAASHAFSTNTNDDQHTVFGLGGTQRIYYLLYAGTGGAYIGDVSAQAILAAFLHALRPLPLWLTISPTSGVTAPGANTPLQVTFNAAGLLGGDYRSAVHVFSNDPDEPDVTTPVHMHVTGAPDILVAPDHIEFGTLFTGATRVDSIRVFNVGTDLLTVSGITASPGEYLVPGGGFSLSPGTSRTVPVTFAPTTPGTFPGLLFVASNDPSSPTVGVVLSGTAIPAPVVAVTPDSMAFELMAGTQGHAEMTLRNNGGSPLTFRIGADRLDVSAAVAVAPTEPEVTLATDAPAHERQRSATPPTEPLKLAIASRTAVAGSVLVIGDGSTEADVQAVLTAGGFTVTVVADDAIWNGFNPSPDAFGAVILLDGVNYGSDMPTSGQLALKDYVNHGGGLYVSEWLSFEVAEGRYATLAPLLPFVRTGGEETNSVYSVVAAHPVTAGLSPSFSVLAGLSTGTRTSGVTLVQHSSGSPAVIASGYGSGKILYCAMAGNYAGHRPYAGADMQRLLLNAADWLSGSAWLTVNPAEGTLAPGANMVVTVNADATMLLGGTYRGLLRVDSNDPVRPEVGVPVSLLVHGVPDILAGTDSLSFGPIYVGATQVESLTVSNVGTGVLVVSSVVTSPGYFTSPGAGFELPPGTSRAIPITFVPDRAGSSDGTIVFYTNDLDSRAYLVKLEGVAFGPPSLVTTPDALHPVMGPDEVLTEGLTIENQGGSDLVWSLDVEVPGTAVVVDHQAAYTSPDTVLIPKEGAAASRAEAPTLRWSPPAARTSALGGVFATSPTSALATLYTQAKVLSELNAKFATVTSRIPDRFDFIEGETGNNIPDGGSDMFDGGNFLNTDRGGPLPYSNNVIVNSSVFGGNCFTRKYPGLFVLSADLSGVQRFTINGNLGADGGGSVDGAVLEVVRGGRHYRGFVKRVFSAGDPSVNHLIIVADAPSASHTFSGNTDLDLHEVTGLSGVSRLYYLLFASPGGGYIDDSAMLNIMGGFLDVVDPFVSWLTVNPSAGTLPPHGSTNLGLRFDSHGLASGGYAASLSIHSNDPIHPVLGVPVDLTISTAAVAGVGEPGSVSFALHGVIPNPPQRDLVVSFSLPDAQPATIDLLDLAGRRIRSVEVGSQGTGRHSISLGRSGSLASGMYLVRLQRAGRSLVSKCLIVR